MNKSLERAQAKVEGRNFDIRKQLLKFDDVMNDQRKAIFGQRLEIMESADLGEIIQDMRHQVSEDLVNFYLPPKSYADQWDAPGLHAAVIEKMNMDLPITTWAAEEGVDQSVVLERLVAESDKQMAGKLETFGAETMRTIEKQFLLQTIDAKWREHLVTLEHLRTVVGTLLVGTLNRVMILELGIPAWWVAFAVGAPLILAPLRTVVGFRGYAQRDPLNEYKTEAFALFESLLNSLRQEVTQKLGLVRPMTAEEQQAMMAQMQAQQQAARAAEAAAAPAPAPVKAAALTATASAPLAGFDAADPTTWGNPARNDLCPCGSGEKFKHCHGKMA